MRLAGYGEAQRKLDAKPSTMQSRSQSNSWFDALTGFHEQLFRRNQTRPSARRDKRAKTPSTIESQSSETSPNGNSEESMNSTNTTNPSSTGPVLSHLDRLEAESIHIMREVMAHAENPVMLYSIGKDSSVMLHLARKAFYPSTPPFPLLHVDTRWKFSAMYEFREQMAKNPAWNSLFISILKG